MAELTSISTGILWRFGDPLVFQEILIVAEEARNAVQDAAGVWNGLKRIAQDGWTRALGSLFAEGKG